MRQCAVSTTHNKIAKNRHSHVMVAASVDIGSLRVRAGRVIDSVMSGSAYILLDLYINLNVLSDRCIGQHRIFISVTGGSSVTFFVEVFPSKKSDHEMASRIMIVQSLA